MLKPRLRLHVLIALTLAPVLALAQTPAPTQPAVPPPPLALPALLSEPVLRALASEVWADGGQYGYEALNLVDGRRTVSEIRDTLSALYGPVPVEMVAGYLETLQAIGVLASSDPP